MANVAAELLKPQPKKRGRKPRSHYLALEAAALAQKQAQEQIKAKSEIPAPTQKQAIPENEAKD